VLEALQTKNIRQFILSAMKQDMLEETLRFHGILSVFEKVAGLDNHYAASKIDRGRELLVSSHINPEKTCMIGDTLHDAEVARELDISCILIADGHQSKKRLETSGVKVLSSLSDLLPLIM
jgi:phosphoglycolate phosphatase